jgi:outer membrane protein OmpA-like peptidoglycan-associated protein/Flp pilus assembly protein TadD
MTQAFTRFAAPIVGVALLFSACTPEGVINKTKYEGRKVTNTCDQFAEEVTQIVDANTGVSTLRIAEYDNSSQQGLFLEPGQFEQQGDMLYFRLINDLQYAKYLQKGVAVQVRVKYTAQEHLKAIESDPEGDLGILTVDAAYLAANKDPFFVYKVPTAKKIDGKQITLEFSVVKLDKAGKVKKVFCNSVKAPLGPIEPNCCTDKPYDKVNSQSVVQLPKIDIQEENYRYQGFTGSLDLIFPMSSTAFNKDTLNNAILNYISKYEDMGFKLKSINIDGYASQGGTVQLNQDLSARRAEAVKGDLDKHFAKLGRGDIRISAGGKGEDWDRFVQLVKTVNFDEKTRSRLLEIANGPQSPDDKEKTLRDEKLLQVTPKKTKLVTDVMEYCRHTYITFQFEYTKDRMYVEYYPSQIPIIAPALYDVARQKFVVTEYRESVDANKGLSVLNTLIDANNNKTGNLYAMRSTYHFALNSVKSAISDIEAALNLDRDNNQYGMAALSYKTKFADMYSLSDRMRLLNDYTTYIAKNPSNTALVQNRAVMMEKVGYLSGALAEYDKLGASSAALLNNRGVARLKASRMTEAEADFKEAISKDSKLAEAYFNLAIVYAWKGHTDKVIENLDKAISINADLKNGVCSNPAFKTVKTNAGFKKFCR